jgi:hypothetical protein
MPEAHMNRTIPRRRRGRPVGPRPLFVEDCAARFDATELLAKCRGGSPHDGLSAFPVTLVWTKCGRSCVRSLVLPVTSTAQPLGGVRRWWSCPKCGSRCRVLLIASEASPVACRRCLGAVYSADYPGRHRGRQLAILLRGVVLGGSLAALEHCERRLNLLLAKRRRGIRRGRRIFVRAFRQLERIRKEPDFVASLLSDYGGDRVTGSSSAVAL